MVKILRLYIIYHEFLPRHENVYLLWYLQYLNCTISFESFMILMRVRNQKTTSNNKLRAIEQIFALDPIKKNILGKTMKVVESF